MEPTPEQRSILKRWQHSTFLVMLIGYIGYYIGRANLPVALPLLSEQFGYTNEQLGIILTFSELAYALGKFTTGPFADRWGGKFIFLTGIIGAIIFNIAFPFFSSLAMFTVIWCFCRYFLSMGWGGIVKTIGEWFEPERNGTIMGLISINFQFGGVFAAVFCGFLLKLGAGWSGLFFYPALVMALIAIWAFFASKASPNQVFPGIRFGGNAGRKKPLAQFIGFQEKLNGRQLIFALLKVKMFRQVVVFSFFAQLVRSIFLFWTPKFLVDLGMGTVAAAMGSAIFPLLGSVGTIFLGWYTDRHAKYGDRAQAMWIMLLGLTVSLLVIAWLGQYRLHYQYWLLFFLGLAGFFLNGPYSMAAGCLSLDIAGPKAAGTCTGIIDGVGYIGGALATWVAGIISVRAGWSQVFLILAGSSLFAVWAAFNMSRSTRNLSSGALHL